MVGLVSCLGLMISAVRWFFYRYRFGDDAIEIQEGVIRRVNKKIPYSNVINVEINQPWIYRLTNYVEAIFDSAGNTKKDGVIPCISRKRAEDVKAELVFKGSTKPLDVESQDALVGRTTADLFVFGLAHNRVFLFIGLLIGLYYKAKELVKELDGHILAFIDGLMYWAPMPVLAVIGASMLFGLSAVLSGVLQVVKSYGYRLWREDVKLVQVEGLLTKKENHMTLEKLQRVVIRQTLLDRVVKRCSLILVQLNGEMVVPALRSDETRKLCGDIGVTEPKGQYKRGAVYAYLRNSVIAFPALLFLSYQAWKVEEFGFALFFAGAGLLYVLLSILRWFRFGYKYDDRVVSIKVGRLDERVYIIDLLKCQAVTVSQSWIEKKLGLASVRLHFVMKTLVIKGIGINEACAIRAQALDEVQNSKRWF